MQYATRNFLSELLKLTAILVLIVIPIRLYVAQPFIVSGASMAPTFHSGEYLIVDELSYHFSSPTRGSVIIFRYPENPSTFFIKRVIGLPGETISIQNGEIRIVNEMLPGGFILSEPYIDENGKQSEGNTTVTLGADEYFVMGDNRDASSDSRTWGPLSEDLIIGRALIRLFPLNNVELFPGSHIMQRLNNNE